MMLLLFLSTYAGAHDVHVAPYVQLATPTSVWIVWETTGGAQSTVEYGLSQDLGQTANGSAKLGPNGLMLHETQLSALTPGSTVYYRTITEDAQSDVQRLHVPDAPSSEASQRLIAMSDMQRDQSHPEIFSEVVNDGIIPWLEHTQPGHIADALDLVLIPGDLVDDGRNYDEWRDTFFEPIAPISASVPVYPVYGNHERDTDTFTHYFHLPTHGSEAYPEHWYTVDHGNIRVIGLDSNGTYLARGQLEWLSEVLEQTCT
ncbi:MAG: 3',5'-cyclic AMP phosphodiesterase CpdA, partial [Kiritimatiellia bacterium]